MKRRKLKKKPIIMLAGIIILFIFLIVVITSCSKEEEIKIEEKEITFISEFSNKSDVAIDDSVKKKIIDFMDLYYLSMKELKEYNMMHLFSSSASKQAYLTQTAMNYLINYRLAQRNDLRLSDCDYNLEVQKALNESFIVVMVDINKNPDLASQYHVFGTPASVFLNGNGSEIHRIDGYVGASEFLSELRKI